MRYTIGKRTVSGWPQPRWAISRGSELIAHYDKVQSAMAGYIALVRDGSFTPSLPHRPVELVFEGRSRPKLSVLSQCRQMLDTPIPEHDPQSIREALYPERSVA